MPLCIVYKRKSVLKWYHNICFNDASVLVLSFFFFFAKIATITSRLYTLWWLLTHEWLSCVWEKRWLAKRSCEDNGALHGTEDVRALQRAREGGKHVDWPVSAEGNHIFAIRPLYHDVLANYEVNQSPVIFIIRLLSLTLKPDTNNQYLSTVWILQCKYKQSVNFLSKASLFLLTCFFIEFSRTTSPPQNQ